MSLGSKSGSRTFPVSTLASLESLTIPSVQEIILKADLGCSQCWKRVACMISRMGVSVESMVVDVIEKKVTLTCGARPAIKRSKSKVAVVQSFCSPHKNVKKC
ncbi:hypothetical protein AAC387_Pa08g2171 [Persea americana]